MSQKEPAEPRRGTCASCGSPSQFVGEPCFFCGARVYQRRRSSLRDDHDGERLKVDRGGGKLGVG